MCRECICGRTKNQEDQQKYPARRSASKLSELEQDVPEVVLAVWNRQRCSRISVRMSVPNHIYHNE